LDFSIERLREFVRKEVEEHRPNRFT
jgi:hypothetical protein